MTKLLVIWDAENGKALPEGKIDAYVSDAVDRTISCKNGADYLPVVIGCLTLLHRFRLASVYDDIEEDRIVYLVDGKEYQTNKTRLPTDFPHHVGEKFDEYLDKMLEVQYH